MSRTKGKLSINPNDIVGKTYGRYEVNEYLGISYSKCSNDIKYPERLRHWYSVFDRKDKNIKKIERRHIIGLPQYK